jgi:hypothetical protein
MPDFFPPRPALTLTMNAVTLDPRSSLPDNLSQVVSRARVADYSEVYTVPREVNAMLDLVKQEKLYAKYGLTQEETAFIESMIRPMEAGDAGDE